MGREIFANAIRKKKQDISAIAVTSQVTFKP